MWQKNVRYLDYNASSGLSPHVRQRLIESLKNEETLSANPSSLHRPGQSGQRVLIRSKESVKISIGAGSERDDLLFTSSGTEANQTVLWTLASACSCLVIGAGEHPATFDLISALEKAHPNLEVLVLPLQSTGEYDLDQLRSLLLRLQEKGVPGVALSLFWANNETGVLTNLQALTGVLKSAPLKTTLHLDAAQVLGKIRFSVEDSPADFVTFSAHKIGALSGTGAIWCRNPEWLKPLISGSQNSGLRGGSENLLGIQAMAFGCEALDPESFQAHTGPLRDFLESELQSRFPTVVIHGAGALRVSNTSRFGFTGLEKYRNWVELLDLKGFAVSAGSACKSRVVEPSRVLLQMGVPENLALNSIRVSLGLHTTRQEVLDFLDALDSILSAEGVES